MADDPGDGSNTEVDILNRISHSQRENNHSLSIEGRGRKSKAGPRYARNYKSHISDFAI